MQLGKDHYTSAWIVTLHNPTESSRFKMILPQIMKGVNMDGWHLSSFELLEKLSHVYHMSEIWAAAGKKYIEV